MSNNRRQGSGENFLGMDRDITRRDFIHGVSLSAVGMALPLRVMAQPDPSVYPPVRTGMRGSHPGSFQAGHALAREGKSFAAPTDTGEAYDLVVVGGGISGLASAWYYRKNFGPDSRILIIENHDDFGGHAKRNEFHQGGEMRLAWGGVFNLEFRMFSDTVHALMAELGVDLEQLKKGLDFQYGWNGPKGPATYFDAEHYGRDVLIPGLTVRYGDFETILDKIDLVPLDAESRDSLKEFYSARTDVLAGYTPQEREDYLRSISYEDFIQKHGGLTPQAAAIFRKSTDGYWGVGTDGLSVAEALGTGIPGRHLLGESPPSIRSLRESVAMFPDGNASIARLLVRHLIPEAAPGHTMEDIVTTQFDYTQLDRPVSNVRIRLNSTAVHVEDTPQGAFVDYVKDGKTSRVRSQHVVLACWHSMIPYLLPALPAAQKEALRYQVKRPLVLTNVLIRDAGAFERLGVSGAYCPGRLHGAMWVIGGVNVGRYHRDWGDDGSAVVQFWGMPPSGAPGLQIREQHRAARARLLDMKFEDFEHEVRTVLNGMLGPAGFDAAEDILAISVNRWPHGYAYDYLDLWDPDWLPGEAPHEIARKRFGNVAFANADAGANAYTHVAIEQAWRAVNDLKAAG